MNCINSDRITGNHRVEPTPAQLRKQQMLEAMKRREASLYGETRCQLQSAGLALK